ncbi:RNA polymerase sigma factor [Paracoccus cavernae]|uniref:RNA polymerase sigma factor n=1 Tax=Paracoccus cavernae TaxID=1571207 RepID=A0ABT8D4X0_9RHOB|nr:RNA polymerase sigma factor [Paracoccus cavernae]
MSQRNARANVSAPVSDWELVTAARHQDETAIRELIRRMNPRLFRVARGIMPSDAEAEEVVQEAYLLAFSRLDSFRGEASFATWITRITINAARMQLRRPRPDKVYDTVNEASSDKNDILIFPGTETAETALGRRQIRALLEDAIASLPADLRLPFILHEVEGLSTRAIATDLQINPITVRTRLFRARYQLRRHLEAHLRGGFDAVFPFDGQRCAGMADRVVQALASTYGRTLK